MEDGEEVFSGPVRGEILDFDYGCAEEGDGMHKTSR